MKKSIVVTDLTRMNPPRVCVAGYTENGECIRPVLSSSPLTQDWLWSNNQLVIRPFAVVEFDFVEKKSLPIPPHTEDWKLFSFHRICKGVFNEQEQRKLLESTLRPAIRDIFGATIRSLPRGYVLQGEGACSLGTIQPNNISQITYDPNKGNYRMLFVDHAETRYDLVINDINLRDYCRYLSVKVGKSPNQVCQQILSTLKTTTVYLRIGLARKLPDAPDRCHLQVTGVYSFPDYLEGCCFVNFAIN